MVPDDLSTWPAEVIEFLFRRWHHHLVPISTDPSKNGHSGFLAESVLEWWDGFMTEQTDQSICSVARHFRDGFLLILRSAST